MQFKVGDRVKDGYDNVGTVVNVDWGTFYPITVEWDKKHSYFGEYTGTYTRDGGRYMYRECLDDRKVDLTVISSKSNNVELLYRLFDEEQHRVTEFINSNNFDCTSAPYVIVKRYRDELKQYLKVLQCNMD